MESIEPTIQLLVHWGKRGGSAILDQGLFSGSNFLLNILLARWLTSDEYGAYTISFTIYLFITGFYIALVLEPASVLGPSRHANHLISYLYGLFKLHFVLCCVLSGFVILIGGVLAVLESNHNLLAEALLGNGLSLTFTLFLWFIRRLFYILQRPEFALVGSALFSIVSVGGVFAWHSFRGISIFMIFIIVGVASLISSIFSMWAGRNLFSNVEYPRMTWIETLAEQWNFGKWRTLGSFLSIAFGQIQTFFTAGLLGLTAVGALRGLQNFVMPIVQLETAIESLGLSSLSSEYGRGNLSAVKRKSLIIAFALFGIASVYAVLLLAFAHRLEKLLYFGKYADYVGVVPILGLWPIFLALGMGFTLPLLSVGKSKYYLVVYAINAPISTLLAFLLPKYYGVTGSSVSIVIPAVINWLVAAILYKKWFPRT